MCGYMYMYTIRIHDAGKSLYIILVEKLGIDDIWKTINKLHQIIYNFL